jgi:hypothetical protein
MPAIINSDDGVVSGSAGLKTSGANDGITNFQQNGTTQASITAAGLFQFNSGYGSVATAYGCRAWVNFNGTGTVAIRASGNVTSITDNASGNYTVNFTTAMPDANYAAFTTTIRKEATYSVGYGVFASDTSTTAYRPATTKVTVFATLGDSSTDTADVYVAVFR